MGSKVFDRANDDAVVRLVANHFHFVLFPTDQRFFNQQLVGRRQVDTTLADFFEFFWVVGNAAASAAQREAGANDHGEARATNFSGDALCTAQASSKVWAMPDLAESRPILVMASLNFWRSSAFSIACSLAPIISTFVLVQHAMLVQVQSAVQRSLATHGGQDRIRTLFGDDALDHLQVMGSM